MYGMAFHGDPPYTMYFHRDCVQGEDALAKLRETEPANEAAGYSDALREMTEVEWKKLHEGDWSTLQDDASE